MLLRWLVCAGLLLGLARSKSVSETNRLVFEISDGVAVSLVQPGPGEMLLETSVELLGEHFTTEPSSGATPACVSSVALQKAQRALLSSFVSSSEKRGLFKAVEVAGDALTESNTISCPFSIHITASRLSSPSKSSWSRALVRSCLSSSLSDCRLRPATRWGREQGLEDSRFTLEVSIPEISLGEANDASSFLQLDAEARTRAGVGSAAEAKTKAKFPIPGLSTILKVFMKLLMAPVFDVAMEKMQDHMEHGMSETFSKDVGATVPKDLVALLAPDLTRNLTTLLADTVPASVTQPLSTKLTRTLAPGVTEAVTTRVEHALRASLHNSLDELLTMKLGADIETALYRSLKTHLIPSLTRSLTHTIVPSLAHALKYRQAKEAGSGDGTTPFSAAIDNAVPISHTIAECLRKAAGIKTFKKVVPGRDPSLPSSDVGEMPVDLKECLAAAAASARHLDLYRAHYASDYYSEHYAAYYSESGKLQDAVQFRVGEALPLPSTAPKGGK